MEIVYIESESMSVKGNSSDVFKRYGKTWKIKPYGKGNGNWILTRKSDVLVNGVSYREKILSFYGKSRLTKNLAERFRKDVENGKFSI